MKDATAISNLNGLLGYSPKSEGVCHGFTLCWLEARLLGQESILHERIKLITEFAQNPERVIEFNLMKEKKGKNLTSNDYKLLDILAFYEKLELFHSPNIHRDLFNSSESLGQLNHEQVSAFASGDDIRALGGLNTVYTEAVAYNAAELASYLEDVATILDDVQQNDEKKEPTAFLLSSIDKQTHTVGLTYNGKKDGLSQWVYVDINQQYSLSEDVSAGTEHVAQCIQINYINERGENALEIPAVFNLSLITTNNNRSQAALAEAFDKFKARYIRLDDYYTRRGLAQTAAFFGDTDFIRRLHWNKADCTTDGNMITKRTPIELAALNGFVDTVEQLIRYDVPVTYLTISSAVVNEHDAVLDLLKSKVDFNTVLQANNTLLLTAAGYGNCPTVEYLVTSGAHIDQISPAGCTALFIAAQYGHTKTVRTLLELGADASIPFISTADKLKAFAAQEPKHEGRISRMDTFIDTLDPSVDKNNIPMSPKDIAFIMGHNESAELLTAAQKTSEANMQAYSQKENYLDDKQAPLASFLSEIRRLLEDMNSYKFILEEMEDFKLLLIDKLEHIISDECNDFGCELNMMLKIEYPNIDKDLTTDAERKSYKNSYNDLMGPIKKAIFTLLRTPQNNLTRELSIESIPSTAVILPSVRDITTTYRDKLSSGRKEVQSHDDTDEHINHPS